jgi:hypothetical protein
MKIIAAHFTPNGAMHTQVQFVGCVPLQQEEGVPFSEVDCKDAIIFIRRYPSTHIPHHDEQPGSGPSSSLIS